VGWSALQALTGTAALRRLFVNMGDGSGFSIQILKFRMTENGHPVILARKGLGRLRAEWKRGGKSGL
jgi:hypothetical protein